MFNPIATYRIQFHKGFTFTDFENIIPYLAQLGVSTIYASPIFKAVSGSNHGYDVTDPQLINPEIGTLDQFRKISKKLKDLNISWLQDIVPNHMAFHHDNAWLWDIMEKGRNSKYSGYFDILWENGDKLMVPFLGDTLDKVIEKRELSVKIHKSDYFLNYGDSQYPLNRVSKQSIPGEKLNRAILKKLNGDPEWLRQVVQEQYYELCDWKESNSRINYRRFFTVNGLICLNMQDELVFNHYHHFIKSLANEGLIQGVRVDHIDGLFDPTLYLNRLRELMGSEFYIVVEKILEDGEEFPADWPVQGNTGYDFLGQVNNLLTERDSKAELTRFYRELTGSSHPPSKAVPEKKSAILEQSMGGELENLYQLCLRLKLAKAPDNNLKAAIGEFLVRCPVYRYYGNKFPLRGTEKKAISNLLPNLVQSKPSLKKASAQLKKIFLYSGTKTEHRQNCLYFFQRCMQFSGPLMAKGVEDTLMYTYDRFIGHNEVGDSPSLFGYETGQFHRLMTERQLKFPLSLSATSTHDTKRGEDVRARLNVLTDKAPEWIHKVTKWQKLNSKIKQKNAPDNNDEYLIYQTLCGIYPLPGQPPEDIKSRLCEYLTKAMREAKVHSSWATPNADYENATLEFATRLLDPTRQFWKSFDDLMKSIADWAIVNSMTQILLKFTCPGIPDVYQGCESWDFSLVDPDNRRPVDYVSRKKFLDNSNLLLSEDRYSGRLKTWLTCQLFHLRKSHSSLFTEGEYLPLHINGKLKNNLIAFARKHLNQWVIVIVPLHLSGTASKNPFNVSWEGTSVELPVNAPLQWRDYLGQNLILADGQVRLVDIFRDLPFGLLVSESPENRRGAGILLPITALPSPYPIGDLGAGARNFLDFLGRSNQKYWQLLPLNPTSSAYQNSPYSAYSSMAGNTLLISLEDLKNDGLIIKDAVNNRRTPTSQEVNYALALHSKKSAFEIAWNRFKQVASNEQKNDFAQFKVNEKRWLDDFALYEVIKAAHRDKPWYEWPMAYKRKDKKAIIKFAKRYNKSLEMAKWLQFVFFKQWGLLKSHAQRQGIKLIGDLPFYISYDSVDVWSNPHLFKLNADKTLNGIAGVPPDYFNANGQLWGMPVYDWDFHAKNNYKWWTDRFRKNLEFFDIIRLDHFRAFYDFWEVPAGEKVAVNGSWKPGPGSSFFKAVKKHLGNLPFIAEDLGDISKGVYRLRDEFDLPGMNVLQYAFGEDMPISPHAPHNHKNNSITYTGTHDNNTVSGWFRQEMSKGQRYRLEKCFRLKVTEKNVHLLLAELCYSSVADIVILPLQDLLGLNEIARVNTPASGNNNWLWRVSGSEINLEHERFLCKLVKQYNR